MIDDRNIPAQPRIVLSVNKNNNQQNYKKLKSCNVNVNIFID